MRTITWCFQKAYCYQIKYIRFWRGDKKKINVIVLFGFDVWIHFLKLNDKDGSDLLFIQMTEEKLEVSKELTKVTASSAVYSIEMKFHGDLFQILVVVVLKSNFATLKC